MSSPYYVRLEIILYFDDCRLVGICLKKAMSFKNYYADRLRRICDEIRKFEKLFPL